MNELKLKNNVTLFRRRTSVRLGISAKKNRKKTINSIKSYTVTILLCWIIISRVLRISL